MKLLLENLPPSLMPQRETLARCLEAMNRALPLREVWLFGSHARGEARPDSDVDLCLVAEGAERQLAAAQKFRHVMWDIWPECSLPRKTDANNPPDWLWIATSDLDFLRLA